LASALDKNEKPERLKRASSPTSTTNNSKAGQDLIGVYSATDIMGSQIPTPQHSALTKSKTGKAANLESEPTPTVKSSKAQWTSRPGFSNDNYSSKQK
jgi:hypothetical protein